jgi:uncharacterized RmlC-like cupin family protein
MKLVKPGPDREVPRGIIGGSEISWATTGASNIYMAKFRVPAGARSRAHYHADCESALYMLSGRIAIRWGQNLEDRLEVEPGDLLYVPPSGDPHRGEPLRHRARGLRGRPGLAPRGLGRGPLGRVTQTAPSVNAHPE